MVLMRRAKNKVADEEMRLRLIDLAGIRLAQSAALAKETGAQIDEISASVKSIIFDKIFNKKNRNKKNKDFLRTDYFDCRADTSRNIYLGDETV